MLYLGVLNRLPREDLCACIVRIQKHNDDQSKKAVIESFSPNALKIAGDYKSHYLSSQDKISAALAGLVQAVNNISADCDPPQVTKYIRRHIIGAIQNEETREKQKRRFEISCLCDPLNDGKDPDMIMDVTPDTRESIEDTLIKEDLLRVFFERMEYTLTGRERRTVEKVLGLKDSSPQSYEDIGKTFNPPLKATRVHVIYLHAIKKLRRDPILKALFKKGFSI